VFTKTTHILASDYRYLAAQVTLVGAIPVHIPLITSCNRLCWTRTYICLLYNHQALTMRAMMGESFCIVNPVRSAISPRIWAVPPTWSTNLLIPCLTLYSSRLLNLQAVTLVAIQLSLWSVDHLPSTLYPKPLFRTNNCFSTLTEIP
jgi:hypothetical protein